MPGLHTVQAVTPNTRPPGLLSQKSTSSSKAGESTQEVQAKPTHANLACSGLTSLADVSLGRSLRVLYLYDNQLTCLQGLDGLCQLTHLYLQNNRLSSLGGLGHLPALQKLYLDGNCIERIDSLQGCTRLQELHLSRQRLSADTWIAFDPATLQQLGQSLLLLHASACGLRDFAELGQLRRLHTADLSDNCCAEVTSLEKMLAGCRALRVLDCQGNPVCRQPKYRADMSIAGQALVELDGKPIKPQEREFLTRLRSRSRRISSHSVDENVVPRTQHHQYPPLQCGTIGSKKGLVSGTLC